MDIALRHAARRVAEEAGDGQLAEPLRRRHAGEAVAQGVGCHLVQARPRADPVASRAISTLRSLFNHARRLGLIEVSPATGVRIMASQKMKRYLSAGEIRHLGKVMTQMEREGEHPTGLAAIRVMLLTGFRRMEALAMRKEWVQPDDNLVRLPPAEGP